MLGGEAAAVALLILFSTCASWGQASDNSKWNYFLGGLGIGGLAGILFAPRSGEESREDLNQKVEQGKEYAQRKAREIRERAEDVAERGTQIVADQR